MPDSGPSCPGDAVTLQTVPATDHVAFREREAEEQVLGNHLSEAVPYLEGMQISPADDQEIPPIPIVVDGEDVMKLRRVGPAQLGQFQFILGGVASLPLPAPGLHLY